jgi:hypothetical protein
MALTVGNQNATTGMTRDIYEQMRTILEPDLAGLGEEEIEPIREGWRKLAFAVATGVITHLRTNMEINGIQTRGNVAAAVNGNTGAAAPANHVHPIALTGTANNVLFTQSNDGVGHVQ